jgi:acyl carrier protein
VTATALPDERDVLALLGTRDTSTAGQWDERIDSLEIAVLIHAMEQRYGVVVPLTGELMVRLATVTGAVAVLREALQPGQAGTG